jgi:uncharacterized circularly permuted ATP-grasp superfamily protein/uncharacterized alpha-E superfamily protein
MRDPQNKVASDPRAPAELKSECAPSSVLRSEVDAASVIEGYRPLAGVFDEGVSEEGELRPHYARVFDSLAELGATELEHRAETSRRLVHEQGITYNIYGSTRGLDRPWNLDPLPLVLSQREWRRLERGLVQRATLLDRILADCYGPQEMIRSGWLPPALVFGQPDFLRPCHGIRPPGDVYLHLYAADLARSPDGKWWVVSDRTQIPTGAGYALANRLVTSRIFPEAFRDCHVERLAGFFRELQTSLARVGGRRSEAPRVVLLTPGPYNETYFEQTYLARYLDYTLVEGQDLTVRDDRVYLKTLSGLEPVDVIVRRVDDDFCDPLELRNESMLGVPGLLQALRAGNVAIANALGSGIVQSPAFLPFLPGLCRHVLGEELELPSVATWWCGQKSAEQHVLAHLDDLFVKPAFRWPVPGTDPFRPPTAAEKAALERRIRFEPELFVAQEWLDLSTAPAQGPSRIVPRRVALRVYLVATENGYRAMPGGLARVAINEGGRSVSMQRGGASKDTWVPSEHPVDDITLLQTQGRPIELRRVGNNLPSRMADEFFWLGRYAERADSTSRLLRSTLARFSPESSGYAAPVLSPLLDTLESLGVLVSSQERPELRIDAEALEGELLAAIFDAERPNSLRSIADLLQRIAMLLRDRTSNDLWRVLSRLDDRLASPSRRSVLLAGDAIETLDQVLLSIAAFHGLARECMTRAQGWRFLDMGCRIERSLNLSSMLECGLRSPEADNPSVLVALLEVAESRLTYRSRYNLMPNIAAVYDLLLLDDTNPRSLLFQLSELEKHFDRLPGEQKSALPTVCQRIMIDLLARLRLLDPRELESREENWSETSVSEVIQHALLEFPRLSDAISVSYFVHSKISRAGEGSHG